MLKKLLLLLALFSAAPAFGQSVQQSGSVTRNHIPVWNTSGVIADGGSSTDSPITSMGVTNEGGAGFCVSSQRQTAAGRNQLCFGASTTGPATISLQNYGTAAAQNLQFVINGVVVTLPTGGGNFIFGNPPFVAGDVPSFANTNGVIQDSGLAVSTGIVTNGIWNGGTIGIPFGGTGATTAGAARTNLGLGTLATQNASSVAITGGTVTGMPSPTNASDVAIKSYVDSTATGLNILPQSRLATATVLPNTPTYANGTLGVGATLTAGINSTLTIDGTVANLNDVVLVKNQSSAFQNGIYTVTTAGSGSAAWVLTRATYFDQAAEMKSGSYTFITAGSTESSTAWTLQTAVTTVGTDPLTFNLFSTSSAPTTIAGNSGNFTLTAPLTNNANALLINAPITPQVRVTLAPGVPVMTTSQAAQATVYVTPYSGNLVPIYDGTNMIPTAFAEVSQTTTDTTKSPAAVAGGGVYDIFCWVDSGTNRCTRGPAWTNTTTRSAGTALVLVNGIYLNNANITNGPLAQRGTYVGTIGANSGATIDYIFGGAAAGGLPAVFDVWNAYNRVPVTTQIVDSTATWTYTYPGSMLYRPADNSTSNRVVFLRGLNVDGAFAQYQSAAIQSVNSINSYVSVALDGTATPAGTVGIMGHNNVGIQSAPGSYSGTPGLGQHFFQAIETLDGPGTTTYLGTLSGSALSGLSVTLQQ